MAETRITIRLDDALLQRLEAARETFPVVPGEKKRDGKPGASTLVRLALVRFLDSQDRKPRARR